MSKKYELHEILAMLPNEDEIKKVAADYRKAIGFRLCPSVKDDYRLGMRYVIEKIRLTLIDENNLNYQFDSKVFVDIDREG